MKAIGGMSSTEEEQITRWLFAMAAPVGGWKCFHTATFAAHGAARSEWSAMERYRRFMHERDRRKITWFAAVEPNPDRNHLNPGFHVHAMWTADGDIWRTDSFKRWANQWGINSLEVVRDKSEVQRYVSKYCIKEQCLTEWEVNGSLWHQVEGLRP
jgi:hypothetical protein